MKIHIEWIENLSDIQFVTDAKESIVLDPPPSQAPQPVLPENTNADTVKPFFPNQEAAQPNFVDDDTTAVSAIDLAINNGKGQASPPPEVPSAKASLEASVLGA